MRNHPGEALDTEETSPEGAASAQRAVIQPAQLTDVPELLSLINDYALRKIMLPRSEVDLCESLRDFLVARVDGELAACGALHFYTPHMAELRSLAVAPDRTRSGLGARIAHELLGQAKEFGIEVVFAFTYVPSFFYKLGFEFVDRDKLPMKAWKDCVRCPMFHACDELAMAYFVTPDSEHRMTAEPPMGRYIDGPTELPTVGQPRILDK